MRPSAPRCCSIGQCKSVALSSVEAVLEDEVAVVGGIDHRFLPWRAGRRIRDLADQTGAVHVDVGEKVSPAPAWVVKNILLGILISLAAGRNPPMLADYGRAKEEEWRGEGAPP